MIDSWKEKIAHIDEIDGPGCTDYERSLVDAFETDDPDQIKAALASAISTLISRRT